MCKWNNKAVPAIYRLQGSLLYSYNRGVLYHVLTEFDIFIEQTTKLNATKLNYHIPRPEKCLVRDEAPNLQQRVFLKLDTLA
jgi:hypothetical protein